MALAVGPIDVLAVEELVIGGSGRDWSETALIFNNAEAVGGSLAPLEADTRENLLPRVKELGGSAVSSVRVIGQYGGNEILAQLSDGDRSTGWRVFTNPNGAELTIDMGAVFTLSRLLFRRGVLSSDERSLRGYEIFVNDGDSLRSFVGTEPVFNLIARDPAHGEPELDISFPPQPVRFLKLRSTGVRSFQMGDLELFGSGVTPFAHFVSSVIELEAPATFGPVSVGARIDSNAQVLFSTKTGFAPDDSLYFQQTGRLRDLEEVTRRDFDRNLDPTNAGSVVENTRDWSAWSPPYAQLQGPLESPDNRQYVQFQLRLISNGLEDKAIVDSVSIQYTVPALADSIIGEISPARAPVGEVTDFTLHLRSVTDNEHRGFDTVLIATPFEVSTARVEVDGQGVASTAQWTGDQLSVSFEDDRIDRTGTQVAVHFETLVTVSGTEFSTQVADSQSDAFPQRVIAGDATDAEESDGLVVGGDIEDRLFADISLSSKVVTPNFDNLNDAATLSYILLKAIRPLAVRVTIHDLTGAPVRSLHDQRDSTGPYSIDWDGRDDDGHLVAPGLYLLRLVAETDGGDATAIRTIAVAY